MDSAGASPTPMAGKHVTIAVLFDSFRLLWEMLALAGTLLLLSRHGTSALSAANVFARLGDCTFSFGSFNPAIGGRNFIALHALFSVENVRANHGPRPFCLVGIILLLFAPFMLLSLCATLTAALIGVAAVPMMLWIAYDAFVKHGWGGRAVLDILGLVTATELIMEPIKSKQA